MPVSRTIRLPPIVRSTRTWLNFIGSKISFLRSFQFLVWCGYSGARRAPEKGRGPSGREGGGRVASCACPRGSAAQAELLDQRAVALGLLVAQVLQQLAAAADHDQQAAARGVVLAVRLQVAGQAVDVLGQQGDLDLGRTGVALLLGELGDDFGLACDGDGHGDSLCMATAGLAAVRRQGPSVRVRRALA